MKRIAFFILLLIPGLALAVKVPPTATQILAQTKAASGGDAWNHIHSLHIEGTVKSGTNAASFTELEDLRSGRRRTKQTISPSSAAATRRRFRFGLPLTSSTSP